MKISRWIKKHRRKKDWSQSDMAKRLNITRQAVSRWENDTATPNITMLSQLIELFDCGQEEMAKIFEQEMEQQ